MLVSLSTVPGSAKGDELGRETQPKRPFFFAIRFGSTLCEENFLINKKGHRGVLKGRKKENKGTPNIAMEEIAVVSEPSTFSVMNRVMLRTS